MNKRLLENGWDYDYLKSQYGDQKTRWNLDPPQKYPCICVFYPEENQNNLRIDTDIFGDFVYLEDFDLT